MLTGKNVRHLLWLVVTGMSFLLLITIAACGGSGDNGGPSGDQSLQPTTVGDSPPPPPPPPPATNTPTAVPTAVPTNTPTAVPTAVPTNTPTAVPTAVPTNTPTAVPTAAPTNTPTGDASGDQQPSSRPLSLDPENLYGSSGTIDNVIRPALEEAFNVELKLDDTLELRATGPVFLSYVLESELPSGTDPCTSPCGSYTHPWRYFRG